MSSVPKYKTRLYRIWKGMRGRCLVHSNACYLRYGARGIQICAEWLASFDSFRCWAQRNGYSDDLVLDRIDNDGDYCPENCQWITHADNIKKERKTDAQRVAAAENGRKCGIEVVCLTTGERFPSAREAARTLGMTRTSVSNAIYRCGRAGGRRFAYACGTVEEQQ